MQKEETGTGSSDVGEKPASLPTRLISTVKGLILQYYKGLVLLGCLASVGILVSTLFGDEVNDAVEFLRARDDPKQYVLSVAIYCGVFVVGLAVGVGATLMQIACAFIFDSFLEVFLISALAENLANWFSFFLGNYVIHDFIRKNLLLNDAIWVRAFERLIKEKPVWYSTLWGFAYVPSWTRNYGLPVLGCPFWAFLISSNIAGTPYVVLWTVVGRTSRDIVEAQEEDEDAENSTSVDDDEEDIATAEFYASIAGFVGLMIYVGLVGYYVNKEMAKIKEEEKGRMELEDVEVAEAREERVVSV